MGALGIGDEWARKKNADRDSWGTDTRRMLDSVPAPAVILDARHVRPLVDLAGLRQVGLPGVARTMPDNNAAMEAAFAACKTEEDGMLAVVRNETGTESAPLRVVIRDLMKRDMLGS